MELESIVLDTERLRKCQDIQCGLLVGLVPSNKDCSLVIVGVTSCNSVSELTVTGEQVPLPNLKEGSQFICQHYPAGTDVVGLFCRLKWVELSETQLKELHKGMQDHGINKENVHVLVVINRNEHVIVYEIKKDSLRQLSIDNKTTVPAYLEKTVTILLEANLKLYLPIKLTASLIRDHLQEIIKKNVIWLPQQQIILMDKKIKGEEYILGSLGQSIVHAELLQSSQYQLSTIHPITITLSPLTNSTLSLPITLNVVGVFNSNTSLKMAANYMKLRLTNQIDLITDNSFWPLGTDHTHTVSLYHFLTPPQHVPVTIAYPHISIKGDDPVSDDDLLLIRQKLHTMLCLPKTQPYLRKLNQQWSPWKQDPYLIDPHLALKLTTTPGSVVAMVTGSYAYHHYLQDGYDDKGWGCAYRSLQTIWSWFRFQGYTERTVPSHHEIQQALVDCGDKPSSFIGSKKWIGSIEVSNVLNHLLEISSRIHHCTSGKELAGTGRILLHHFETEGTPVMIGGGVLAHTILGVEYNEQSGDIRFLILDPHYIGPEDVKQIQTKGQCGWKTMSFWDQTVSYNMCMPIKPQEI